VESTLLTAFIFVSANVAIGVAFVVVWLKNFQESKQYLPVAMTIALIVLATDVISLYVVGFDAITMSPTAVVTMEIIVAFRMCVVTMVGLLLAARLNNGYMVTASPGFAGVAKTSYGISWPAREAVFYALLTVAFMVIYSTALFKLSGATINPLIAGDADPSLDVAPIAIFALASIGFAEEIAFRLGLQNALTYWWRKSRFGHHWAVLCTTSLWSIAHIGVVDPEWAKLAQIFVFGLLLGQMNRRFGVAPCVIAHVLFNIIMAMLTPMIFGA